jgi:hypothetical protein
MFTLQLYTVHRYTPPQAMQIQISGNTWQNASSALCSRISSCLGESCQHVFGPCDDVDVADVYVTEVDHSIKYNKRRLRIRGGDGGGVAVTHDDDSRFHVRGDPGWMAELDGQGNVPDSRNPTAAIPSSSSVAATAAAAAGQIGHSGLGAEWVSLAEQSCVSRGLTVSALRQLGAAERLEVLVDAGMPPLERARVLSVVG